MDEDLLRRCARNCGGAYAAMSTAMGRPVLRSEALVLSDLGVLVTLPPNNVTLLEPLTSSRVDSSVETIDRFFAEREGGGYELWSAWPTPDLSSFGLEASEVPGMFREPGGAPTRPPPGLDVREAIDGASVADAEALWIECFGCEGSAPGSLADERLLRWARIWVGYVEDRPVTTSLAYRSDGVVGIFCVATTEGARGHGYGEAVTWAAVSSAAGVPAVLQASDLGKPVYERMGFRTVNEFIVWEGRRRTSSGG